VILPSNIIVKVEPGKLDKALAKLKKKFKAMHSELARHEFYGKPSERRRQGEAQACRRRLKAERRARLY
jgi:ribosomal protein S21